MCSINNYQNYRYSCDYEVDPDAFEPKQALSAPNLSAKDQAKVERDFLAQRLMLECKQNSKGAILVNKLSILQNFTKSQSVSLRVYLSQKVL